MNLNDRVLICSNCAAYVIFENEPCSRCKHKGKILMTRENAIHLRISLAIQHSDSRKKEYEHELSHHC